MRNRHDFLAFGSTRRSVLGIEAVPPAVKDARRNAKLNNIKNAEFICENAETALPRLVAEGKRFSAILLDPPRRGAEKPALDAIVNSGAERIAYVSCNPATLARDCKILAARRLFPDVGSARGYVSDDTSCGDGMSFVQTKIDSAY